VCLQDHEGETFHPSPLRDVRLTCAASMSLHRPLASGGGPGWCTETECIMFRTIPPSHLCVVVKLSALSRARQSPEPS
jgi:hypothetical protein